VPTLPAPVLGPCGAQSGAIRRRRRRSAAARGPVCPRPPTVPRHGVSRNRVAVVLLWVTALAVLGAMVAFSGEEEGVLARVARDAPVFDPADRSSDPGEDVAPAPETPRLGEYRGGPRHTARSPYRGPASGVILWRYETAGRITAQPTVTEAGIILVPSHDHGLHGVAPDGEGRFTLDLLQRGWAAVLADGDRIWATSDAGLLLRFPASGEPPEATDRLDLAGAAETAVVRGPEGDLFLAAGPSVFRLTPEGEVRWRFDTGGAVVSSPAVDADGRVYVGSQDDHLYALAADGRMRWRHRADADIDASPVIADEGTIVVGADDGALRGFAPTDGVLRWETQFAGPIRGPAALGRAGEVYVSVYGPRPRLACVGAADGEVRWSFALGEETRLGSDGGAVVDADGNLYFGAHDGFFYALDPQGELRWVRQLGGAVDASPILLESGVLLVGADDGVLYGIGDAPPNDAPPKDAP
jgi:outer membrane protein assembly factor BamB